MNDELEITIASHPRWLRLIRQVVEEYARQAGFDKREVQDIALAVDEAACNVMKHSYRGDASRPFSLSCRRSPDGIEVEISDRGEPFDPAALPTRPPDELRPGGRGIYLMRAVMDEVQYDRRNGANVLRLKKLRKAPAGSRG